MNQTPQSTFDEKLDSVLDAIMDTIFDAMHGEEHERELFNKSFIGFRRNIRTNFTSLVLEEVIGEDERQYKNKDTLMFRSTANNEFRAQKRSIITKEKDNG